MESEQILSEVPSRILDTLSNHGESREASRQTLQSRPTPVVSRMNMHDLGFTEYEIEAIVARLMGHWMMSHQIWEIMLPNIALFIFFQIFSYFYFNSSFFTALEVPGHGNKPILLGLKVLYYDVLNVYTIV